MVSMVTVFREELNKLYTVDGVTPDSVASVLILQPRWAHRYWKRATTAVFTADILLSLIHI